MGQNNRLKFKVPVYLHDLANREWKRIENLSLRFSKFVPFGEDKKGSPIYKPRLDLFGYKIQLPNGVLAEYKRFYKLQKSLWKSKLRERGVNPDDYIIELYIIMHPFLGGEIQRKCP